MDLATRAPALAYARRSAGALVLALALPTLFVHVDYQPSVTLELGPAEVSVFLSDLAVLAVALAALASARREGIGPLRRGLAAWLAAGGLLAVIFASMLLPLVGDEPYALAQHAVSAAKFAEYAVLALAVPLLVRRREDLVPPGLALVAVSVAATLGGALQFLGLVDEFEGRRPGQREPSFVGIHDFAALSAAALALAFAAIVLGSPGRRTRAAAVTAGTSGVLGVVLAGAVSAVAGVAAAAGIAAACAHRRGTLTLQRGGALVALVALVGAGTLAMRSDELDQFLRFLGVKPLAEETREQVQTYSHRTVLAYIGVRIWLDHPVAGVGWQQSRWEAYKPYVGDARRRFPDTAEEAFPSPQRPWGVQNVYVQALADLGLIGFALLCAALVSGVVLGLRPALRGPPSSAAAGLVGALLVVVAAAVLAGLGLVAGAPTNAVLWLGIGLAVTAEGLHRD